MSNTMTLLTFDTKENLLQFKDLTSSDFFEINIKQKTLLCDCCEKDISLAVSKYGAKASKYVLD
jgi:hypothetical protein